MTGVQKDVAELRRDQYDRECEAILTWLTPTDYSATRAEKFSKREHGTGQWFLDSPQYQRWVNMAKLILFCKGIPGAGKTTLTSIVINSLYERFDSVNSDTVGIAYVYCDHSQQAQQKVDDILASLIKQLARSHSTFPRDLKDLYDQRKPKQQRPTHKDIVQVLQNMAKTFSKLFIIVDAIDEFQGLTGDRAALLREIFALSEMPVLIFL
jgi:Cdc6-like AAA superfamily ATPase